MKKNYFKKSLSLIMTVLMIMSCWVFVAPTEAEAAAIVSATETYNKAMLNGINTSIDTTMPTTMGKFKDPSMEGDENASWHVSQYGSQHYKNIFYSPTVDINGYAIFWGSDVISGIDSVRVYYPETVMIYDGSTKPQMGVVACLDGASRAKVRAVSLYLDSNANGLVITDHWKGHTTGNLAHIINMHNGSYKFANTYEEHGTYKINTEKNGEWYFYASDLRFDGTLSSDEFVRTVKPTWGFYGGKASTANRYTQTASKNIYVMNVKAYRDLLTTIANDKTNIVNNAAIYTPASVKAYVNAANAILNLNPKNVTQSGSAVATWGTNMTNALNAYNTAKNGLVKREFEVTYENIFSLADWKYSTSSEMNNVSVDLSSGKITVKNDSTTGEYVTAHSGSSGNSNTRTTTHYAMPVVGGQEYTFKYTTDGSDTQMFAFFYDVNGGCTHENTFGNYNFTVKNGTDSATFKAPDNSAYVEIRFDNNVYGTANFSNIMIYPTARVAEADVEDWFVRPYRKLYAYNTAVGTLDTPVRKGHVFNKWLTDTDGDCVGDAAAPTGNITTNKVLYSDWTAKTLDIGYDNLFSLSDWAYSDSSKSSNSTRGDVVYDLEAGTITVNTTRDGEVYTNYGTAANHYQMAVEPNTEYIFKADMNLDAGTKGQMFVFFYDANGNGLTGANNGAITNPHIGIYPTSNGTQSITFTTPAGCTQMAIRVGATDVGTTATYSNIGFFKKADYNDYASGYSKVREPFKYRDTDELMIPTRDGFEFAGWFTADGTQITSVDGLYESDTVYATWVKKYKITFLNAKGETFQTAEVISGDKLTALPTSNPSKDSDASNSYSFDKWMYNGAEFTTSTEITGDIDVTPSYTSQAHGDFKYTMTTGCTEATCEENAKVKKTCGKCSYNFGIVPYDGNDQNSGFLKKGHEYDETDVEHGSSNGTQHKIRCVRYNKCGSTKYVDHVWSYTETTGATCSIKGTVHYTCPCQATKTEEGALAPDVHVNTKKINYIEPTCLTEGKDYDTYCNDCKKTVATGDPIEALGHSFTKYVSDGDATCTVDGHETAKCDRCDVTDTRVDSGSALGHDWTEKAEAAYLKSAADCENDAVYYYACSRCNVSSKDDDASTWTDAGTASGHDYTGAAVRNNNNGTHSYICKNGCNTYGYIDVKDAAKNCTYGEWDTTGATEHKNTCTECGYVYTEAHDWSTWKTADGATGEAPAQQTRSCKICGKVETKNCTYTSTHEDATCTSPERTTYSCSECGHGYTVIGDPAKGHNFTSGTYKYNATSDTHQQLCVNGCGLYGVGTTANAMESCSWTYENDSDGKHIASCVCDNSQREVCTGGTATCTEPKTCEKCNTYYGDKADHSFTGAAVVLDGDKHAFRCVYCNDQTIYGVGANVDYTVDCSGGTATCSEAAKCTVCGDPHGEIDADNHKWINPTNNEGTETHTYTCSYNSAHTRDEDCFCSSPAVEAPDCEAAGYQQNYCDDCGHGWQSAQVDALGHKWGNWESNNDGTHTRTCEREGCTYNSGTPKTETASCTKENAKADVTDPTCLEKGYTTYTCNECGYVWVDDEVAATGHSYLDKVKKTDSTYKRSELSCTTALTYWYVCDNCDVSAGTETDKYDDITLLYWIHTEPTDHNFSKKVVDAKYLKAEATCTESAVYYYSCANENCGASSAGTANERTFTNGAPLGHDWENTEKYLKSEADCVNNEVYYKECSRCHISSEGETNATWTKENTMTGHDFDHDDDDVIGNEGDAGYVAKKDPTCSEEGNLEYYLCQVCGKKYADEDATTELSKVVLDSLGHSWVAVPYKAATCVEDGYTSHKACSRCNEKNADYQVYPMIGHNFSGAYYYDKIYNYHAKYCVNENCTTYGLDGVEYKVEYDGLDYTFVGGEACVFDKFTASTNEAGEHSHNLECVCGNAQNVVIGTENIKTEVVDPTCTEAGYTLNTCQKDDCGMTWKTAPTAALGHDLTGDATSNGNGTHSVKCKREGCTYSSKSEKCSTETPSTTCGSKNKCDVCHGEFGEAIAHVFTNYVYNNDATCTADGTKTAECDNCDINATDTVTAPGTKLGHDMTAYGYDIKDWQFKPDDFNVEIKEPTCGAEGRSISYCTRCSHYLTKVVPKDGSNHKMPEEWTVVGGNCASGVTYVRACTVCGKKESKTENIPHEWKAVVIEEAGCTVNGYIDFECKVCGFVATLNDSVDTWPSFDGVDYSDKKIVATGKHSWQTEAPADEDYMMVEGVVVFVEEYPTYNTTGRGYKKCTICNVVEKVIIEAYGNDPANHKHPELGINDNSTLKYVAEVKPTCTVGGHKGYYECTRCSYSQYVLNHDAYYLGALGHADKNADGKCDTCKTKLEEDAASKNCGCICHKNSGFMKFIYMILRFFWKLFGMNKTCACGVAHY